MADFKIYTPKEAYELLVSGDGNVEFDWCVKLLYDKNENTANWDKVPDDIDISKISNKIIFRIHQPKGAPTAKSRIFTPIEAYVYKLHENAGAEFEWTMDYGLEAGNPEWEFVHPETDVRGFTSGVRLRLKPEPTPPESLCEEPTVAQTNLCQEIEIPKQETPMSLTKSSVEIRIDGKVVTSSKPQREKTDLEVTKNYRGLVFNADGSFFDTLEFKSEKQAHEAMKQPVHLGKTMRLFKCTAELKTDIPVISKPM